MSAPIKILLIENNPNSGLIIKNALSASGIAYLLTTVSDNVPADEILKSESPEYIILDYKKPVQDQPDIFTGIKRSNPEIPLIVISDMADEAIAVKMMKEGAADYLSGKLVHAGTLAVSLRELMERRMNAKNERSEAQARKLNEERLEEAQKIAKTGSWEYDMKTGKIEWSAEVLNILGVYADDVAPDAAYFRSFIHPEDDGIVMSSIKNLLAGGKFNVDFRIIPGDHRIKHLNSQGYTVAGDDGAIIRITGIIQDITQRKKTEYDLFLSEQQSRQSLKVKENFIASMSHEIRTPMNAIMGFANLLYTAGLDKQDQEYAHAIKVSGENLLSFTDDMLDVSTLKHGQTPVDDHIINLPGLVGRIVNMLDAKAAEKAVKVSFRNELTEQFYVHGDAARITQVLINLLGNSIKFTESGKLLFALKQQPQTGSDINVEFTIKHPAEGMKIEKLLSVFNGFNDSSELESGDYGMGSTLNLSKNLPELPGGVLEVKSIPGEGSSFTLNLKLKKAEQHENLPVEEFKNKQLMVGLEGKRVLVVEDNRLNQALVKKVLCDFGLKVDIAEHAEAGIQLLMVNDYDIVLMDLQMPGMDGYAACEFIRNQFENEKASVPVVAMTAHVFKGGVEKCFAAGMDGYISKPFEPVNLYSKILKVLNKHLSVHELKDQFSTNTPVMTQENNITDLAYLKELSGGNEEFLVEMITLFNSQVPEQIAQLFGFVETQDWNAMRALAHKMSPSLAFMGLSHEFTQIKVIEKNAESRNNLEQIPDMLRALKVICEKAIVELTAELAAMKK
jgi:CheY-like chemotaxis protein/nitrogen-specific signal transduction histidine kinase/HPt (histidine-containing phosphotransfer) domain-containing protein